MSEFRRMTTSSFKPHSWNLCDNHKDGSHFLMIVVNYLDEATNNYKTPTDDYSQIIYTSSSGH